MMCVLSWLLGLGIGTVATYYFVTLDWKDEKRRLENQVRIAENQMAGQDLKMLEQRDTIERLTAAVLRYTREKMQ